MPNNSAKTPQPTTTLEQFNVLIGKWTMVGTHPMLSSTVSGQSKFEWLREGALLVWHFEWERGREIPTAYSIIGHDDAVEACSMLYTDERGVSRIYQMTLADGVWKMWRDSAGFSQRMTGTFSDDNNTITWRGEMSKADSTWEPDLSVIFTRK